MTRKGVWNEKKYDLSRLRSGFPDLCGTALSTDVFHFAFSTAVDLFQHFGSDLADEKTS